MPAITPQQRAQRLQALGSRGGKAVLPPTAGDDDAVDWSRGLVAPVGPTKLCHTAYCGENKQRPTLSGLKALQTRCGQITAGQLIPA